MQEKYILISCEEVLSDLMKKSLIWNLINEDLKRLIYIAKACLIDNHQFLPPFSLYYSPHMKRCIGG